MRHDPVGRERPDGVADQALLLAQLIVDAEQVGGCAAVAVSVLGGMAGPSSLPRRQGMRAPCGLSLPGFVTLPESGMMAGMSNVNGNKMLVRTRDGRIVAGVCSGLAEYFGIDANLIRAILAVVTVFSAGFGALAYLAAWVVIPEEGEKTSIAGEPGQQEPQAHRPRPAGAVAKRFAGSVLRPLCWGGPRRRAPRVTAANSRRAPIV